ncbi:MAG: alpha/beta hydrolase [bacterium]
MPHFSYGDHRLFYREQGEGPLVIILPGNTASSAAHAGELKHFGQRYHAVSLDLPGTGRSDRLEEWPDDWWMQGARAAGGLMDHLSVDRAVLMGSSGGAVIALRLALESPDRVRGVIADSCVMRQPPEVLRREVARRRERSPETTAFWRHAHGQDWEEVVEADSALLLRLAEHGGGWFEAELSEIGCPVLLTGGLRDTVLHEAPAQMLEMAGQIPRSELILLGQGDHPVMWTRPGRFRDAADSFLAYLDDEEGLMDRAAP